MKILAPAKNLLSGVELINAWADEIYFWVVSMDWEKKHDFKSILNRRDGRNSNVSSYEDGKRLIDYARSKGAHSYITLNNSPVIDDIDLVVKEIENCIKIRPDALIVKDIFIADMIRKIDKDIPIHCSSLNQTINKHSVAFWVERFNISRMILPRNVSVNEIKDLCESFPNMEFEIFIKNDWCYNTDGVCSSIHQEWLKEGIPFVCNREILYKSDDEALTKEYVELVKSMLDCKICIYAPLRHLKNLVSLKIAGREKPLDVILKDLQFIKSSFAFLTRSDSTPKFMDFTIQNYEEVFQKGCGYHVCEVYNMYYKDTESESTLSRIYSSITDKIWKKHTL